MRSACATFVGLASACDICSVESIETATLATPKSLLQEHDVPSSCGKVRLQFDDITPKKTVAMMGISNGLDLLRMLERVGTWVGICEI